MPGPALGAGRSRTRAPWRAAAPAHPVQARRARPYVHRAQGVRIAIGVIRRDFLKFPLARAAYGLVGWQVCAATPRAALPEIPE